MPKKRSNRIRRETFGYEHLKFVAGLSKVCDITTKCFCLRLSPMTSTSNSLSAPSSPLLRRFILTSTFSSHVKQQIPKSRPRLHSSRQDLTSWQNKAIRPRVSQLDRKGILSLRDIRDVVNRATRDLIDSRADRPGLIDGAVDGANGGCDAASECVERGAVGCDCCTGVAVC